MNLKSLTLHGFKSFGQRETLQFSEGIVAVVGPNGSGKSNISDAIRWVLGEQSVRMLRGHRLEDVMFSGSDHRRAVGMAEVTVTFDNKDRIIPIEYSEVTISRRVYRSGESEFSINRNPCRLRDIQELFMDTGLGKGSLSIIGQGEVDLLLNARPEDRRAFLEEAAGITKYRARKNEAVRQLTQTKDDLLRITDIVGEVERQLKPLRTEAEAARTYQTIQTQLQAVSISLLWKQKKSMKEQWQKAKEQWQDVVDEQSAARKQLARSEERLTRYDVTLDALDSELEKTRREKQTTHLQETEMRHRQRMERQKLEQAQQERAERLARIQTMNAQIEELRDNFQKETERKKDTKKNQDEIKRSINRLERDLAALRERFQQFDHAAADERLQWQKMTETLAALTSRRTALKERHEQLTTRLKEHGNAESSIEQNIRTATQRHREAEHNAENVATQLERYKKEYHFNKTRAEALAEEVRRSESEFQARHKIWLDLDMKLKTLLSMERSREGYHRGVQEVLKASRTENWNLLGAVAELIHVPAELEAAIDVALGASQQFIIAQKDVDAQKAIEYLRRGRLGRATFLPLDSLKPRKVSSETVRRLCETAGAVGVAADLIQFSDPIRPAIEYLLGRIAIARTLKEALPMGRSFREFSRIVTLDGDVIVPGGAMTGGSRPNRTTGLVGRSRRLEQLKQALEKATRQRTILDEQRKKASDEKEQIDATLAKLNEKCQRLELANHTALRDLDEAKRHVQNTETMLNDWTRERDRLVHELDRTQDAIHAKNKDIDELRRRRKNAYKTMHSREEKIDGYRQKEKHIEDERHELLVALAGLVQKEEHHKASVREMEKQQNELHKTLLDEKHRNDATKNRIAELQTNIAEAYNDEMSLAEQLQRIQKEEREIVERRDKARRDRIEIARSVQNKQRQLQALQERITKAEVQVDRCRRDLEALEAELHNGNAGREDEDERYADANVVDLKQIKKQLKAQLDQIGSVNLNSIEQLKSIEERYEFLTVQKHDLEEAKQKLHEVIHRIDGQSREKFNELFKEVQTAFARVFTRLFQGGKARLELTDPDNPLESGVEIFVQPPGKRLQSLMALSGGERALAAIALLFSILAVRPSPFCVLDEIDAALDEHNVMRFRDLLREFSSDTQFLIITHRQGTMESADTLFGVTMEQSGVSRLVSINLEDVKSA